MAKFVRNLLLPIAASAAATSNRAWYTREFLLCAGWTDNSNNGDAAWSSALNLLASVAAGPNGFSVDAAKPREIYSPSGVFLPAHVGAVVTLKATNDQNAGLWRIVAVLDAYNVLIDSVGWFPQGWITETGIAARVTTGVGLALTAGAWALLDSPAGYNVQIRVGYTDSSNMYIYARPRGKLGDVTEITSLTQNGYYMQYQRFNCYAEGADWHIISSQHSSNSGNDSSSCWGAGYLTDADAADTDPVFVISNNNSFTSTALYGVSIRMLTATLAQIEAYATSLKIGTGRSVATAGVNLYNTFGRRLINGSPGYASIRTPWVVLADTVGVGGCVRGRLSMFKMTYQGLEVWSPIDALGNWQHIAAGIVAPRNGPYDPLITLAYPV